MPSEPFNEGPSLMGSRYACNRARGHNLHCIPPSAMRCTTRAAAVALAVSTAYYGGLVMGSQSLDGVALPLQRVAFGSCNDQSAEQPLWPVVLASDPQLWVWMGDAIYGDYKEYKSLVPPFQVYQAAPPAMLEQKYSSQMNHPGYSALVQQMPVIGVWDDHDYGLNDGGRDYLYRKQSQSLFLDFLGEASDSPRRLQDGVYTSYTIGSGHQSVKFVLLDVRYNKDPYHTKDGDFLGDAQWEWLEQELRSSSAAFNVIVSGVQMLPQDRGFQGENWDRFPAARARLINLILNADIKGVILLSGDVHYAEINQVQCDDHLTVLTEITSSGMTHSWGDSGAFDTLVFGAANLILPSDYRPHRRDHYGLKNFGEIVFDWDATPIPKATVIVRGEDGEIQLQHTVTSHYAEQASLNSASTCQAINASLPLSIALRRLAMIGFVGLMMGTYVSVPLACVWVLVVVFRRSFTFMMGLQHRIFDTGYQKLD